MTLNPSTPLRAALAAAALIALSGCSLLGGGPDPSGSDPGSAPSSGATPVQGGAVDPGKAEERATLASQDVTALDTDMHFAVHGLKRNGRTVELTFSATNTGDELSGPMLFWLNKEENATDVGGITLIDPDNAKVHLVARDSRKKCVCSAYGTADKIPPGGTEFFSATFGAPPASVEAMTVRMPHAGSFDDVPVS